jgi:glucose/arabinose dehydrogenase
MKQIVSIPALLLTLSGACSQDKGGVRATAPATGAGGVDSQYIKAMKAFKKILPQLALLLLATAPLYPQQAPSREMLQSIRLPRGFVIEVYASGLDTARGLAFAPDGTLFVGSKSGSVHAVLPDRRVLEIARGLTLPVGLDFHENSLYVSSLNRVVRLDNILADLDNPPRPVTLPLELPGDRHHGWKFIKIGPDGRLYVPVGAPCNSCVRTDPRYASILRVGSDGGDAEVYAAGVRNTVGFDWHPDTGRLWFTDNGRDRMGDDLPPDELNRVERPGQHFGFPYLHGRSVRDPEYWEKRPATPFAAPRLELPAHVAALGMRFYTHDRFPPEYQGGIFIAEHGSWNRSEKIGYRVSFVELDGERVLSYTVFASGWLQGQRAWGRPADVEVGPDGALYVSDDLAGAVYRISHSGF